MEKLLAFSTQLQAQGNSSNPPPDPKDLDPSVLDHIFGANPADEMRKAMDAIEDPSVPLDQKEIAFDNLEMLVEHIDNANNLVPLQLWPRLLKQLESPESTLRRLAAWTIATAVQNNPKSQQALIENDGLKILFGALKKEDSDETKNKVLYAITSELKLNEAGIALLDKIPNSWEMLIEILELKHSVMTKRVIFFFYALLIQEDKSKQIILQKAHEFQIPEKVYRFSLEHSVDEDCVTKSLHTLYLFQKNKVSVANTNELLKSLVQFKSEFPEIFTVDEWKAFHEALE